MALLNGNYRRFIFIIVSAAIVLCTSFYTAFVFELRPWHQRLKPSLLETGHLATNPSIVKSSTNGIWATPTAKANSSGYLSDLLTDAAPSYTPTSSGWSFSTNRDSRDYKLTADQCDAAFPGLYTEIERAVKYRKTIGRLVPDDVDISWGRQGLVRALIADQQLYVIEERVSGSDYSLPRALAILHAIHRAIVTSPEPLPDIEFSFSVSDISDEEHLGRPIWALSRTDKEPEKVVMSDFGYWSWPLDLVGGYDQIRREIADIEIDFAKKKPQAVWRGAVKTNSHRKDLLKVASGKEWADVKGIMWANAAEIKVEDHGKAISTPEHCLYQFVIQTEGHSYSGRGKYLQNCNSIVIIPKRTWIEPHHALLRSGENFVEVEQDFSDLEEKVTSLLADPVKAQQIAKNGVEMFRDRYLTPAAQACYWRRLITSWAEVSFVPEIWDMGTDGGRRRVRGIPFETFVIQSLMSKYKPCTWMRKVLLQC